MTPAAAHAAIENRCTRE